MKDINAYLTFDGNCRQAMEFYAQSLGAELVVMPFSETQHEVPDEAKDRIMHARLSKGTVVLMASDSLPSMPLQKGNNFSVTLNCENMEEIENAFNAIAENGNVTMPLQDTFWGARFGMLTDQFGINWMFNFEYPKEG